MDCRDSNTKCMNGWCKSSKKTIAYISNCTNFFTIFNMLHSLSNYNCRLKFPGLQSPQGCTCVSSEEIGGDNVAEARCWDWSGDGYHWCYVKDVESCFERRTGSKSWVKCEGKGELLIILNYLIKVLT